MSLKLGTFPVERLIAGSETSWRDGVMTVDVDALTDQARSIPNVDSVSVDITSPGDCSRIIHVNDVIEPRVKIDGPGVAYPGACNRSVDAVGSGTTYRLGGLAIVESAFGDRRGGRRPQNYIDMSGPGAATPYANLHNIVVTVDATPEIGPEDSYLATHGAVFRVMDVVASTVSGLTPPDIEDLDTEKRDTSLPGVVFICNLMSNEHRMGPDSEMGTAVYGVTRLSAPWLLQPEEMVDGALSQRVSWHFTNNPIVRELMSRHGKELNFLGCIIQRTNWGGQRDMQLSASRSARMAKMLGASGAIITTNIRGRRFVDTVLGIQACEQLGIRATLITEEEDDENGAAPALLVNTPEMEAVVSTGAGAAGPFPPVDRVLGLREGELERWSAKLPDIAGRYGAFHRQDYYGFGKQSRVAY